MRAHRKKLATAILAVCFAALSASASAEQPKAEEYRALFASGNFYVKYGVGTIKGLSVYRQPGTEVYEGKISTVDKYKASKVFIVSAANDGKRMKGIYGKGKWVAGFNYAPIRELLNKKTAPDVLYKNGKYYRTSSEAEEHGFGIFSDKVVKSKALMLSEDKLGLETLDPTEGWGHIRKDLAIPNELLIFCWNDPYRDESGKTEAPHFIKSTKRTINDKIYECDEYALDKQTASGTILSQDIWRAFYEGGNLVYVQLLFLRDGQEDLISMIDVREISSNAPAELFELPVGTLVYAADEGKMYDLTEQGLLLEKVGENKKKSSNDEE